MIHNSKVILLSAILSSLGFCNESDVTPEEKSIFKKTVNTDLTNEELVNFVTFPETFSKNISNNLLKVIKSMVSTNVECMFMDPQNIFEREVGTVYVPKDKHGKIIKFRYEILEYQDSEDEDEDEDKIIYGCPLAFVINENEEIFSLDFPTRTWQTESKEVFFKEFDGQRIIFSSKYDVLGKEVPTLPTCCMKDTNEIVVQTVNLINESTIISHDGQKETEVSFDESKNKIFEYQKE